MFEIIYFSSVLLCVFVFAVIYCTDSLRDEPGYILGAAFVSVLPVMNTWFGVSITVYVVYSWAKKLREYIVSWFTSNGGQR